MSHPSSSGMTGSGNLVVFRITGATGRRLQITSTRGHHSGARLRRTTKEISAQIDGKIRQPDIGRLVTKSYAMDRFLQLR